MSDRDEKGDEMSDRMSRRFGGESETAEESEETQTSKTTMTTKTEETSETGEASETGRRNVTDLPSVLMYLPEELKTELSIRFDELNAKHKREHDEELEKNRDYYPAIVEAALDDEKSLEEILIEKDDRD